MGLCYSDTADTITIDEFGNATTERTYEPEQRLPTQLPLADNNTSQQSSGIHPSNADLHSIYTLQNPRLAHQLRKSVHSNGYDDSQDGIAVSAIGYVTPPESQLAQALANRLPHAAHPSSARGSRDGSEPHSPTHSVYSSPTGADECMPADLSAVLLRQVNSLYSTSPTAAASALPTSLSNSPRRRTHRPSVGSVAEAEEHRRHTRKKSLGVMARSSMPIYVLQPDDTGEASFRRHRSPSLSPHGRKRSMHLSRSPSHTYSVLSSVPLTQLSPLTSARQVSAPIIRQYPTQSSQQNASTRHQRAQSTDLLLIPSPINQRSGSVSPNSPSRGKLVQRNASTAVPGSSKPLRSQTSRSIKRDSAGEDDFLSRQTLHSSHDQDSAVSADATARDQPDNSRVGSDSADRTVLASLTHSTSLPVDIPSPSHARTKSKRMSVSLATKFALVVDSSPVSQQINSVACYRSGFRTESAASAEDAIAMLRETVFDIVLVEATLSGVKSLEEFISALRTTSIHAGCIQPLIMVLTPTLDASLQASMMRVGANALLEHGCILLSALPNVITQLVTTPAQQPVFVSVNASNALTVHRSSIDNGPAVIREPLLTQTAPQNVIRSKRFSGAIPRVGNAMVTSPPSSQPLSPDTALSPHSSSSNGSSVSGSVKRATLTTTLPSLAASKSHDAVVSPTGRRLTNRASIRIQKFSSMISSEPSAAAAKVILSHDEVSQDENHHSPMKIELIV